MKFFIKILIKLLFYCLIKKVYDLFICNAKLIDNLSHK